MKTTKLQALKNGLSIIQRGLKREDEYDWLKESFRKEEPIYLEKIQRMEEDTSKFPERDLPCYSINFNQPIKNDKLTKYGKLLLFLYQHKDKEFTKYEMFKQSGWLNKDQITRYETGVCTTQGYFGSSTWTYKGKTIEQRFSGYGIRYTVGLKAWGIIEYNQKTRKWKAGKNLEAYLKEYGLIK